MHSLIVFSMKSRRSLYDPREGSVEARGARLCSCRQEAGESQIHRSGDIFVRELVNVHVAAPFAPCANLYQSHGNSAVPLFGTHCVWRRHSMTWNPLAKCYRIQSTAAFEGVCSKATSGAETPPALICDLVLYQPVRAPGLIRSLLVFQRVYTRPSTEQTKSRNPETRVTPAAIYNHLLAAPTASYQQSTQLSGICRTRLVYWPPAWPPQS
jgi:hypothetical protein